MIENSWWAEKYRPKKLDEYVADEEFKGKMTEWLSADDIPHLLLYSSVGGTGKTTAAKMLATALSEDVMYIDASEENGIDIIREKITRFVTTVGFGKWKIVILDEAAGLTPQAQESLKTTMERFSKHARFILTCNYLEKIVQPIRSRCRVFHVNTPPKKGIAQRMAYILGQENVIFEPSDLKTVIETYYPDQRSIINYLQDNSRSGKLVVSKIVKSEVDTQLIELLKSSKKASDIFKEIRQLFADNKIRQFQETYRTLYEHLDDYAKEGVKGSVILALADGQYKDAFVVDKEINIMATIVAILNTVKG